MVNEDIITALRNAVNNGEPLNSAVQIMVNSGYNPAEVMEASNYIAQGVTLGLQTQPVDGLTMSVGQQPGQLGYLQPQQPQQPGMPPAYPAQQPGQFQQPGMPPGYPAQQPGQFQQPSQPKKGRVDVKLKKPYTKEIILVAILVFLIGILIATIVFRETILSFFSG
ncbi:MAG: hypothetical protein V1740_02305 [Candidatus Woesearchaeota archaeon]